jgi:MoxR-like ATPase
MRFSGTERYVATDDLAVAVNAAVALERPLLVKGEPGTGKTELARQVAEALGLPLIEWHVKSTTGRSRGSTNTTPSAACATASWARPRPRREELHPQGQALAGLRAPAKVVLLIDEIDKADIEFPNDLLQELDRMEFHVYETGETIRARHRPVVIITSNNEKELPDAFLRRCFFHYIRFPDMETLKRIVEVHHPGIKDAAPDRRADPVLRDPRDGGAEEEALDLRGARLAEAAAGRGPAAEDLRRDAGSALPKLHGALLKNEQDVQLFERLAFMARRQR